jgi:serine/threonine protein kinase
MQEYTAGVQPVPGFNLIKFLGRGGFGQVWKATAPGGIRIAMKFIDLHEQQALKELRALNFMRLINHPHLTPIQGLWVKDDQGEFLDLEKMDFAATTSHGPKRPAEVIIAMGLGDKNLLDRLRECQKEEQQGIPVQELVRYMEESAKGIDYLNQTRHDMGGGAMSILHCDIKPQNILIVGDTAQVCDFGLARVVTEASVSNPIYTAAYVAPEMLRDNRPSPTTDQYSLAISYVEMRTGSLPFSATGPAMLYAHLAGKLDLSKLTPNEEMVIRRATDGDPTKRFPNCLEMAKALRHAVEGSTMTAGGGMRSTGPLILMAGEEIVPGYKLKKLLGKGGYGAVWEAHAPGGIRVALKVVRNLDAPSGKQEFRALELMKSVKHRHLLEIHAYWLLDKEGNLIADEDRDQPNSPRADTLVLATHIAQYNLSDRLKECQAQAQAGIPKQELLSHMFQVADALDYLNQPRHRLGEKMISIVHRDIKPENILVAESTIKVADFGLAKILESTSAEVHAESVGMTLAYAAPELMDNRVTPWTDQYALGLTYYRLRTGYMPFGVVQSQEELIAIHITGRLDLGRLPEEEQRIIAKATALKPEERFATCTDMVRGLMKACKVTEAEIVLPQASHAVMGRSQRIDPTERMEQMSEARAAVRQVQEPDFTSFSPQSLQGKPGGAYSAFTSLGAGLSPSMSPPPIPDTHQEKQYRQETDWQVPSYHSVPATSSTGPLEKVMPPPEAKRSLMPWIVIGVLFLVMGAGLAYLLVKGMNVAGAKQPTETADKGTQPTPKDTPTPPLPTPTQTLTPTQTQSRPIQSTPTERPGPNRDRALAQLKQAKEARAAKAWPAAKAALTEAEKEAGASDDPALRTRLQLERGLQSLYSGDASHTTMLKTVQRQYSTQLELPERVELARALAALVRRDVANVDADALDLAVTACKRLLTGLSEPLQPNDRNAVVEDYAELVSMHLDRVMEASDPKTAWAEIKNCVEQGDQAAPWTLALRAEALLSSHSEGNLSPTASSVADQANASAPVQGLPSKIGPYLRALTQAARGETAKTMKTLVDSDVEAPWTKSELRSSRAVGILRQAANGLRKPPAAAEPFASKEDATNAVLALDHARKLAGNIKQRRLQLNEVAKADDLITFTLAAWHQEKRDVKLARDKATEAMKLDELEKRPGGCAAILVFLEATQGVEGYREARLNGYLRLAPLIPDQWPVAYSPPDLYAKIIDKAIDLSDQLHPPNDVAPNSETALKLAPLHAALGRLIMTRTNLYADWGEIEPMERGRNAFYQAAKWNTEERDYQVGWLHFETLMQLRMARQVRDNPNPQALLDKLKTAKSHIERLEELNKQREAAFLRAKMSLCQKDKNSPGKAYVDLSAQTANASERGPEYLPLMLARVELCLAQWSKLVDVNPETELSVARAAERLAEGDPIAKAVASADLTMLHLTLKANEVKLANLFPTEEVEKRLREAVRLAPKHPQAWSWRQYLGTIWRNQSQEQKRSVQERRKLAEDALREFRAAYGDTGLERPDKEDQGRIQNEINGLLKELKEMPPS